jgi:hypothetical protein
MNLNHPIKSEIDDLALNFVFVHSNLSIRDEQGIINQEIESNEMIETR